MVVASDVNDCGDLTMVVLTLVALATVMVNAVLAFAEMIMNGQGNGCSDGKDVDGHGGGGRRG